ncbi:MAG: helix-turn-helix domain-containing protein [Gammaproteobacteria bacterium]|nr:helix-turn-helix domain-containing protein [Gammaproteobacteria bacterium]
MSYREAKLFARLRAKGRSLRSIARRHGRSHHTVARWLTVRHCSRCL